MCRIEEGCEKYLLGYLNSCVADVILDALNPTMHFQPGDISRLPWRVKADRKKEISMYVQQNIDESHKDWDSFETSWDFPHHPLLRKISTIAEAFDQWQAECDNRFNQLKVNEEELNRMKRQFSF